MGFTIEKEVFDVVIDIKNIKNKFEKN